jgi:hypothetical protein
MVRAIGPELAERPGLQRVSKAGRFESWISKPLPERPTTLFHGSARGAILLTYQRDLVPMLSNREGGEVRGLFHFQLSLRRSRADVLILASSKTARRFAAIQSRHYQSKLAKPWARPLL